MSDQPAATAPLTSGRLRALQGAAILGAVAAGALLAVVLGVSTTRDWLAPPAIAAIAAVTVSQASPTVDNPFPYSAAVAAMSAQEAQGYVRAIAEVDRAFARARASTDEDLARLQGLARGGDSVFAASPLRERHRPPELAP